jgi:hypothetical protein
MKRFSTVLLACLFVLLAVVPAFGQVTYVSSNDTAKLGKRLNIGANPVYPAGYPSDSLAAHASEGWHLHAFDFPIAIRCSDRDGKIVEGYVDKLEPLIVSVLSDGPSETVYEIHVIQKCGNPVYGRWVSVAKPMAPSPPGPEPPKVLSPPPPPPVSAPPGEEIIVTEKGGWKFPFNVWAGSALSRSLENKASDAWLGVIGEVYPSTKLTYQVGVSRSWANFDRFGRHTSFRDAYAPSSSRLVSGFKYRPVDDINLTLRAGVEYDHQAHAWLRGPVFEGSLEYPTWRIWNTESFSYQTGTKGFFFRSRHMYALSVDGPNAWKVGGDWILKSFREEPFGEQFRTKASRVNGLIQRDGSWIYDANYTIVAGVGRGRGKPEGWAWLVEAGTGLKPIVGGLITTIF